MFFEEALLFLATNAKYTSLKVAQNEEAVDLHGNKQIFTPNVTSLLAAQYSYHLKPKTIAKACEPY